MLEDTGISFEDLEEERKPVIGYASGTFDLFHTGHLNLLRHAKEACDYLIVGVHESGAWKGKATYMSFEDRKALLRGCRYVDEVVDAGAEDSEDWERLHFDRLFAGSDYRGSARFKAYEEFFRDKDVEIIFFPYTEGISSTMIRDAILEGRPAYQDGPEKPCGQ